MVATQVRHPIWLPAARKPGARTFASLYALDSAARATISSLIPIQAYDLLGNERGVSLLYAAVAIAGLTGTLLIPLAIERLARRRVYSIAVVFLIVGSLCLATQTLGGQAIGMLVRVIGASALSITLNLYIMDHIRRTELIEAESLRLAWSTLAWAAGPVVGVLLYSQFGLFAPHGMVALISLMLLALFWFFRLSDNPAIVPGRLKPARPLANVGRFIAQPRLRLAWFVAFARSCFWTTFFIYAPLLMVVSGVGGVAGGLIVSAGNALLFTAIFWGRIGRRYRLRRVIALAFLAMAAMLVLAAGAGASAPWMAAAALLCGAFFAIALDALGSAVFMRAVHAYERPQMTAVYRTYLDFSEILPPLIYAAVLAVFGLNGVFLVLAVFMAASAWVSWRYLPARL